MGIRFDLQSANWLAHIIDSEANPPKLKSHFLERETLRIFLERFREQFYSSPRGEYHFQELIDRTLYEIDHWNDSEYLPTKLLQGLRAYFSRRSWTALLVPSGRDSHLDRKLCSREFLRQLVEIRSEDPGLILQLEEAPSDIFSLTDVFPAFRTALAHSTEWPGILLWTVQGGSTFLPLPLGPQLDEAAKWIFSHLAISMGVDLKLFNSQYASDFNRIVRFSSKRLQILQISDIHIGSAEARKRLPRVQQLIRNLADKIGDGSRLLPVVTGDLMDSPDDANLDSVRAFLDFLSNLGSADPIVVLGNHDVRKNGYLGKSLRQAMRLPAANGQVVWLEDEKVGLVCFNSVTKGQMARGMLGEQQLQDVGNEIDRNRTWRDYSLVGILHHHPIPVGLPDWYVQPFYERVLGSKFATTETLIDAAAFLAFTKSRKFSAILHGHKHIPRANETEAGIPVFGCGSTVGKVPTSNGQLYMSINVITIDPANRKLSGRLLAEQIPGGGLEDVADDRPKQEKAHEVLARSELRTSE